MKKICFSCDHHPQKYITGLCEGCHRDAMVPWHSSVISVIKLQELEAIQNDGQGVSCVKSILSYLNQDDWHSAEATFNIEHDKIRSYSEIDTVLHMMFRGSQKNACPCIYESELTWDKFYEQTRNIRHRGLWDNVDS